MIHQDVPHYLRRNSEKVGPVLPFLRFLADKTQIHLVHQGCALQGVIGALSPEAAAGDAAQLLIDQGNQRIPSALVAAAPISQEKAYLRG
jgi:hypothetical protein